MTTYNRHPRENGDLLGLDSRLRGNDNLERGDDGEASLCKIFVYKLPINDGPKIF